MPKMRPFFSFYGGKWRTNSLYPLPVHDTIIEPFAGSAGYSVRNNEKKVILCDLDPVIVSLWEYLIKVSESEILSIPDVPLDGTVLGMGLPEEQRLLVSMWVNKGISSPCNVPSKWMRSGNHPGSFWGDRVRNTISSQLHGIRHWEIHHCSYVDYSFDGPATWFIDPPYQSEPGSHYKFSNTGIDYSHLAQYCKDVRGQKIVCEGPEADWLPFAKIADTKTTRKTMRSGEYVWLEDSP